MIDVRELRIGNKLIFRGQVVTVDAVYDNPDAGIVGIRGYETEFQNQAAEFSPIPITPEVLMKCGFIDPAKNGWGYRIPISSKDELCWYMQDGFIRLQTQGSGFTLRMDHVTQLHQLQNIFFFLTGEELTVNL